MKFDWLNTFGLITKSKDFRIISGQPFPLHYDNEGEGGDGEGDDGGDDGEGDGEGGDGSGGGDDGKGKPQGKFMSQAQIDKIVEQRLKKERSENRKTLARLQQMEQNLKMSDDERATLQKEIEELEKRTMTAEEIRKREAKKAETKYETELKQQREAAETWKKRHDSLKLHTDITTEASRNGVLPNSLPLLAAFLEPRTQLVEITGENGEKTGKFTTQTTFEDRDEDGKPLEVTMSIGETIARMRELDEYSNLFDSNAKSGTGTNNGTPPGQRQDGYRPGMSMADYLQNRENILSQSS